MMKLIVLLGLAACAVAYPQRDNKFHQSSYDNVNEQYDYSDNVNAEDEYNANSMDIDYGQPEEGKSFEDINFVRNMDEYDNSDDYNFNSVNSMDDYGTPEEFNQVKNMEYYDQSYDTNEVKMDDYIPPNDGDVQSMDDYIDVDNLKDSDFKFQDQYEDAEDFKQQGRTSEYEEEQAAVEEYNRLRNHEIHHEFAQKYNNEDYSNKMRAMEEDFESVKETDDDYISQGEDDYEYMKQANHQGGDYNENDDDYLKYANKYQDDDYGSDDDLKYAKYQGDDGDDDDYDDNLKYAQGEDDYGDVDDDKYGKYQGEDDDDYDDDVKYANKYGNRQRYNGFSNENFDDEYDQARTEQDDNDDLANAYRYSKREVKDLSKEEIKDERPCKCSSSERSLFTIKDPQEYWFKKIPSSLNLPTLTFNLSGVPKEAKEILIHAMVHSGWQDKGTDDKMYVGQVVLSTISKGTKSFQEGVMFYPFAKDESYSYSTAHVSLPVTDERRVHVTIAPPAPKGKLHNVSLKIKVVAYRV